MNIDNNIPIIVTILLAIAAWTFTHAVNRFLEEPIVKFSRESKKEDGDTHTQVTFTFTNISHDKNFADMELTILGKSENNKFTEPKSTIVGLGWTPKADLTANGDGIDVKFDNFHPGWKVVLTTTMSGNGTPQLQLKSSRMPTVLQEAGFKTCIIENEILITTILGLLAFFSILFWLICHRHDTKA